MRKIGFRWIGCRFISCVMDLFFLDFVFLDAVLCDILLSIRAINRNVTYRVRFDEFLSFLDVIGRFVYNALVIYLRLVHNKLIQTLDRAISDFTLQLKLEFPLSQIVQN